ncbi:ferritin-like domain-containing protein [Desulfuromonas acetexigens]|uniref:Ferritin n=1 Tax=Trichloromonas acetexigens TaxID=38815 RepID=A0A550JAG9_9BACT|nr:ferritin family protein [Desulfuromonas acetexigens]TRO80250.1 ferritin [Desulfuromonas acetexigens]
MSFVTMDDIIKFAVKQEEAAYNLYKNAAAISKSISAKKMFEEMAREEAGHKEVFGKMSVEKAEHYKKIKISDLKISQYLADVPLKPDMTYQEILIYAMKAEENAYQLYTNAAASVEDPQLQKVLNVFADVEKGHKIKIEKIYDEHVLTEN